MFLASRHSDSKSSDFMPYHIQGLEIWATQKQKFPCSVGDKLNNSNCLDIFYYGELHGLLCKFISRYDYQETLKIDLTNQVEIKVREGYEAPFFNCIGGLPVGKGPFLFHIVIDFKNNTIEAECDDVPIIFADEKNMGINFNKGYYNFSHLDYEFFKDWTGRVGDLIIFNHRLDYDLAELVEEYLKNKGSFYEEEKDSIR